MRNLNDFHESTSQREILFSLSVRSNYETRVISFSAAVHLCTTSVQSAVCLSSENFSEFDINLGAAAAARNPRQQIIFIGYGAGNSHWPLLFPSALLE